VSKSSIKKVLYALRKIGVIGERASILDLTDSVYEMLKKKQNG